MISRRNSLGASPVTGQLGQGQPPSGQEGTFVTTLAPSINILPNIAPNVAPTIALAPTITLSPTVSVPVLSGSTFAVAPLPGLK
jgi:hypothetical protein